MISLGEFFFFLCLQDHVSVLVGMRLDVYEPL